MNIEEIKKDSLAKIDNLSSVKELEDLRVALLGKSGSITGLLKEIANVPAEKRKEYGQEINSLKEEISSYLDQKKEKLSRAELETQLAKEKLDLTQPSRGRVAGKVHPISQTIEEITLIFAAMGFAVEEGPSIEDDWHNFTALNIDENHPARQMHDTFYMPSKDGKNYVLRTHTSPIQIRTMKNGQPPFRFIAPGRTYRCDSDMTHTPMFHQIEGLLIDKNINMGHLKNTIIEFLKKFFERDELPIRFRPSFFPFTEPSAEVDIGCKRGKDELLIGQGDDWLEILGCGMVHPNVLANCGIDPEEYKGFAFGMGVERMAMLKYGIPDLRDMFESDIRWNKHYGFKTFNVPNILGRI